MGRRTVTLTSRTRIPLGPASLESRAQQDSENWGVSDAGLVGGEPCDLEGSGSSGWDGPGGGQLPDTGSRPAADTLSTFSGKLQALRQLPPTPVTTKQATKPILRQTQRNHSKAKLVLLGHLLYFII